MPHYMIVEDLKIVLDAVWSERTKWRKIGKQLKLTKPELKEIKQKNENTEKRFIAMLTEWLRREDPKPSWEALVDALNSSKVNSKATAEAVLKQFLPDLIPEPETVKEDVSSDEDEIASEPSQDLLTAFEELKTTFTKLVRRTYSTLVAEQKFTVSFLRSQFKIFPCLYPHQHQKFLDQYLLGTDHDVTAEDIWSNLSSYWNFMNHKLLKFVIVSVGRKPLSDAMDQYESSLNEFLERVSVHDIASVPNPFQNGTKLANSNELLVKFINTNKEMKLVHLKRAEEELLASLNLPSLCGLILRGVSSRSKVTWLLPSLNWKHILRRLTICDIQLFEKHNIECVWLDKELCYRKGHKRIPVNFAHEEVAGTTMHRTVMDLGKLIRKVVNSSCLFTLTELCTAYVCHLLTTYLANHPYHREKNIQVRSFDDLPPDAAAQFKFVCKEALERTILDYEYKSFELHLVGLCFDSGERRYLRDLNQVIFDYLAAWAFAPEYKEHDPVESWVRSAVLGKQTYFIYFVAGMVGKDFDLEYLGTYYKDKHVNLNFILFEMHSSSVVREIFLERTPLYDQYAMCYSWPEPLNTFCSGYFYAFSTYYGSSLCKFSADYAPDGVSRGFQMALENFCDLTPPSKDLRLEVVVFCNTADVRAFLEYPYTIYDKIFNLCLYDNDDPFSKKECTDDHKKEAHAELMEDILKNHTSCLEHVTLSMFNEQMWDSAVTNGIRKKTKLKFLKFIGRLYFDHAPGLWELLRNDRTLITELNFISCGIGDGAAFVIADMLKITKTLKKIVIFNNDGFVSTRGVEAIAEALEENRTLSSIEMHRCRIVCSGACAFGKMLPKNNTLRMLAIGTNLIGREGLEGLAEGLALNTGMTKLVLRDNMLLKTDALAEALRVNRVLHTLDISWNDIDDMVELARSLKVNTSLVNLIACRTEIEDDSALAFKEMLSVNKTLMHLDIDCSENLTDECVLELKALYDQEPRNAKFDIGNDTGVVPF